MALPRPDRTVRAGPPDHDARAQAPRPTPSSNTTPTGSPRPGSAAPSAAGSAPAAGSPVPAAGGPAPRSQPDDENAALRRLLQIEGAARRAVTEPELSYLVVNDTMQVVRAQQVFLVVVVSRAVVVVVASCTTQTTSGRRFARSAEQSRAKVGSSHQHRR